MNFLTFSKQIEEPIPGLGLVRQSRHPERNAEFIRLAIHKRNAHCFNMELNHRCLSYRTYKRAQLAHKQTYTWLAKKFPTDMVDVIFEFYDIMPIITNPDPFYLFPYPDYSHIKPKNEYRWYIMLSNITPMLKHTGLNPTHLHRYLCEGEFHITYNHWLSKMDKLHRLENDNIGQLRNKFLTPKAQLEIYDILENLYKRLRL